MERLGEIAAQISATERRAMKAERETADRLIAHFLADRIGASFEGRVSGVHRAGLFVKLIETGADGFVPARTIGDEYFAFDEAHHSMVGQRSGETYRLGDTVTVKLVEAAPVAGALRFEILSAGRQGTLQTRHGKKGRKSHLPNPPKRPMRGPAGRHRGKGKGNKKRK
jgi:ribonuclease R